MKRILTLLLLFNLILSCSSDDNDDSFDTSGNIVGTWTAESVSYTGTLSVTNDGESYEADILGEGYDVNFTVNFSESPNTVSTQGTYSIEVTTTTNNQSQVQNVENLEFEYDGLWIREGDNLIIANQGQITEFDILQLTNSSLRLQITVEEDLSDSQMTVFVSRDVIYSFTR